MVTREIAQTRRRNIGCSEDLDKCLVSSAESTGLTVTAFIRKAVERECELAQDLELTKAAELLAGMYETDEELTAFTGIDGDDFL